MGRASNRAGYTHGNGLVNMKQRCEQLGGNWMIESAAGKGVTIICTFLQGAYSVSPEGRSFS